METETVPLCSTVLSAAFSTTSRWFLEPVLAAGGVIALVLAVAGLVWGRFDNRRVRGEPVAIKPTKFALSIGVYLLTAAWMLGWARPERLSCLTIEVAISGLLGGAAVELFCITCQAARGRTSHFNLSTPTDAAISGTMLIFAMLFIGMLLPIAWEIARRPRFGADPLMIAAIVTGLAVTFFLGSVTGGGMGRIAARTSDLVMPLIGVRLKSGHARVAHFLGVHAMQALPLMAAGASCCGRAATAVFTVATLCYVGATLTFLHHATNARGTPAPDAEPASAWIPG